MDGAPLFGDFGGLLFPVDSGYWGGDTLRNLSLAWYSHIRPARTVGIVNVLREQASAGNRIFYRIYSEEEMRADPRKADTGLSEVTGEEPPTCSCVGTDDGIASYRTMQEGRAGYGPRERIRRSRCSMAFPTALDWARGPSRRVGSIAPWLSGNGRCDERRHSGHAPVRRRSSRKRLKRQQRGPRFEDHVACG